MLCNLQNDCFRNCLNFSKDFYYNLNTSKLFNSLSLADYADYADKRRMIKT
jgi:hypothetical protein